MVDLHYPSGVSGTATLGRLFDRLGSTLLSVEAGPFDPATSVSAVAFFDPYDPPTVVPGTVVLWVGTASAEAAAQQIRSFSSDGAVALVMKEPIPNEPEIAEAVAETGIVIFGLIRGASWIQVASMLSSALSVLDSNGLAVGTGSDEPTDLFELANMVADLLQAPVTIEDLSSRVLAFSADQAGTDESRRLTILGLQVPDVYEDDHRAQGVFRRIYTSDRPVFIHPSIPTEFPRVAMRVKAGEEVLGSIWAVVHEPLTDRREQGFVEAASVVALTMLRARASSDSFARQRLGLVNTLIEGGQQARDAAKQLNIASLSTCVIAFGTRHGFADDALRSEAELQRVVSSLNMYLHPLSPGALAALVGGTIYAVVPLRANDERAQQRAVRLAREFIARMDSTSRFLAGVGSVALSAADLDQSRSEADAALRVLQSGAVDKGPVQTLDDVQVAWLMLRIASTLADDGVQVSGPLAVLIAHDEQHNTAYVETLKSWLEHFGDIRMAADAVHVHRNTFRFRLARLCEIGDIDLSDADTRFGLILQLRLFG
ncbi:DNA-binding transcriptional regulator, PucR family [Arthrobacter sp. yr096]|uniref:PucR family transcriptional regulator n=1 Tax=Arthrobacter sp. yr096 TaxID=1761750 RepID=UPI0008B9A20E|nr:PucR family transcriptional regulator [Arthrobacter sp. yr096]SEI92181.1 DNA-binding transcriptional regulator, PucR family [Arthrobacter sp. yr096]